MENLTFKNLEWDGDLVGFIATLSNGKIVQIQFELETSALHADCGTYYPHIDYCNSYGLDLTDDETKIVNHLIQANRTILQKALELSE